MTEMVEVVIDSIRVSLMSQSRIVILREVGAERYLPIWIGVYEAEAIALALQEVEVARPMTWDLLKNIFTALNARILRIEVVDLHDETFFGNIVTESHGQIINIDSRPSDALALAVRTRVPILVARSVMDSAGIVPEEDLQESDSTQGSEAQDAPSEGGEGRLSVFEDFLEKLDLGDSDQDKSEEEPKDKE
jgi:hypothetical protein